MCDIRREGFSSEVQFVTFGMLLCGRGVKSGSHCICIRNHSTCALLSYLFSPKWPWVFLFYMVSLIQTVTDSPRALSLG